MISEKKENQSFDGSKLKIAIVAADFHQKPMEEFLQNTLEELKNHKVENIVIKKTSGALELPYACQKTIEQEKPDGIITLGIIIRGETIHFELVANNSYRGLMQVQLQKNTPIAFGILSCENVEQVQERVSKNGLNKGKEAVQALLKQIFNS